MPHSGVLVAHEVHPRHGAVGSHRGQSRYRRGTPDVCVGVFPVDAIGGITVFGSQVAKIVRQGCRIVGKHAFPQPGFVASAFVTPVGCLPVGGCD